MPLELQFGPHVTFEANRRFFAQSFAVGAGTLAASQSEAAVACFKKHLAISAANAPT
jgi:hypothetical protein